jgi:hypothetical protein
MSFPVLALSSYFPTPSPHRTFPTLYSPVNQSVKEEAEPEAKTGKAKVRSIKIV